MSARHRGKSLASWSLVPAETLAEGATDGHSCRTEFTSSSTFSSPARTGPGRAKTSDLGHRS